MRENLRCTLVSGWPVLGPDHEAIIRFGGVAPRQRAHSVEWFNDHVPARVTTTSDRQFGSAPNSSVVMLVPVNPFQPAGRKTTPSSISPVVTKRQSAMSSLRASATIIVVLRRPLWPSVRLRNH